MSRCIPFVSQISDREIAEWLEALRAVLPGYDVMPLADCSMQQCAEAQVAIVANPHAADLKKLPHLQWVQSLWAGVDQLLIETQLNNVAIVRMNDPQLAETMAEAVLAWALYLHRDMPRYRMQQSLQIWQQHTAKLAAERTVGILGLGNLGRKAAKRLFSNGFRVLGWSRSRAELKGIETFCGAAGFTAMLQRVDILICLLPLTAQTQGLIGKDAIALMPKGSALINFARGPIVDTDALMSALNSDRLSHAVLDVFDQEPLPQTSPLWSHPNITILPHISAPTNRQTASLIVAKNINRFFVEGEIPLSVDRALGY